MRRVLIVASQIFPPLRTESIFNPATGEITIRYAEYFENVSTTIFENESEIVARIDAIDILILAIDVLIAASNVRINANEARLDTQEGRLDAIDIRLDAQEARLDNHDIELENAFQLISEVNT
tara:strand:- start:23315 stop:23683 length:369 start_codon:yes stop_codon:yes gene_type:complete